MATRLDGNVRKATPNTVTAMRRSAEMRRCPKCKRGSALVHVGDQDILSACRWAEQGKCDYVSLRTTRYGDWFEALGNDIPAGNREAAVAFLVDTCGRHRTEARKTIGRVAHYVSEDKSEEALATLRALLGGDEVGVFRAAATLCCPPRKDDE